MALALKKLDEMNFIESHLQKGHVTTVLTIKLSPIRNPNALIDKDKKNMVDSPLIPFGYVT